MNPYLEIARRHLTIKELELLIKEKKRTAIRTRSNTEKRRAELLESLIQRKKNRKK